MAATSYHAGARTQPVFLKPNLIYQDSWRGEQAGYVQDLEARVCTCPHFQHRLAGTGLLCKHLEALLTTTIEADLPTEPEATEAEITERLQGWDACAYCGARGAQRTDAGDPESVRLCVDCWLTLELGR